LRTASQPSETTRRPVQSALFQLLLFAARQAIAGQLPGLAGQARKAQGRIVTVIPRYVGSHDDARDLLEVRVGHRTTPPSASLRNRSRVVKTRCAPPVGIHSRHDGFSRGHRHV
jgi:hypothetical protein